ncbi:MAG TPA: hypothetical protein VKS78_12855 [Roseiarcus sp.]|nr:hypothetical protein [Roseiarcus sp.]
MIQRRLPAISHELQFIAIRKTEADDIYYEEVVVEPFLKRLSDSVHERAQRDMEDLLNSLKDVIGYAANGLLRVNDKWSSYAGWKWWTESDIYRGTRGRKSIVGRVGLCIGQGDEGFRLIGYFRRHRGGASKTWRFAQDCKKKIDRIHLTEEKQTSYPGWSNQLVWFTKELALNVWLDELQREIGREAKRFFQVAKPLLESSEKY